MKKKNGKRYSTGKGSRRKFIVQNDNGIYLSARVSGKGIEFSMGAEYKGDKFPACFMTTGVATAVSMAKAVMTLASTAVSDMAPKKRSSK